MQAHGDPKIREQLLDALEVLEHAQPASFEAAFDLLATYVPGIQPSQDEALAAQFRLVISLIRRAKDRTLN